MVKNLPANTGDSGDGGLIPGLGRCPGGGNSNPLQVFLPEIPLGERSLAGYSPWDHKELDPTKRLRLHKNVSENRPWCEERRKKRKGN